MSRFYIVTGANGHLGSTVVRFLQQEGAAVCGLILPGEKPEEMDGVCYIKGDVRERESLRPLFEAAEGRETFVIHTAGIIDISEEVSPLMYDVNVNGTKNIIALCEEYNVQRLVYVSCDSATLARDLKYLCSQGYELKCGRAFDNFPMGGHVETVIMMTYCGDKGE